MGINSKCTKWWTMPNGSKLVFVEPGQNTAEAVHHISTYLKAVNEAIKRFKSNMFLFQLDPVPWGSFPSSNWTGCMLPTPFSLHQQLATQGYPMDPGKHISLWVPLVEDPGRRGPWNPKLGSVMFELGLLWSWHWCGLEVTYELLMDLIPWLQVPFSAEEERSEAEVGGARSEIFVHQGSGCSVVP